MDDGESLSIADEHAISMQELYKARLKKKFSVLEASAWWLGISTGSSLHELLWEHLHAPRFRTLSSYDIIALSGCYGEDLRQYNLWAFFEVYKTTYELIVCNCLPREDWNNLTLAIISRESLLELAHEMEQRPFFLFQQSTNNKCDDLPSPTAQKKDIDPRTKTSLHLLVATLADALGYSPNDKATVSKIKKKLEHQGVGMSEKTIRTNIKEAFETLNEKRE